MKNSFSIYGVVSVALIASISGCTTSRVPGTSLPKHTCFNFYNPGQTNFKTSGYTEPLFFGETAFESKFRFQRIYAAQTEFIDRNGQPSTVLASRAPGIFVVKPFFKAGGHPDAKPGGVKIRVDWVSRTFGASAKSDLNVVFYGSNGINRKTLRGPGFEGVDRISSAVLSAKKDIGIVQKIEITSKINPMPGPNRPSSPVRVCAIYDGKTGPKLPNSFPKL